uniref:NADH-ubiquinone oxidoreductase chain 5 n=1 Tax=Prionospio sp. 5 MH-2023 TaxID=3059273 RepID=A0AAU6QH29_9ANNE
MFSRSYPLFSSFFLYTLALLMLLVSLNLLPSSSTIIMDWVIATPSAPITMTLIMDPHGTLLSSVVLFISANVMVFAHSYMAGDPFTPRFIQLVLLFVASMNFLIFIPNLITLLLGWDGLGLVSFLLVIYYQNAKSLGAGMITALTNRIGDVLILISIAWCVNIGYWNLMFSVSFPFTLSMSIALMVAAMTKSAQIPFSSWLPAAMAAPTPVSALVHSSTLVTAGVFLLFRFYPTLSLYPGFNKALLIMATLTCLMAGLSANTECDMKKIIALSTLSQLGVMMVSLGLGAPLLALFHLITHALFKALLFLCAGTLIHLHHHSQDLRFMGNLPMQMPSISSAMMVSNLALCGTPFLAGFYSKDAILEYAISSPTNLAVILLFFFATGLTVSYTIRFLVTVVWGPTNVSPLHPLNDNDIYCSTPTFILATFSVLGGSALNWILLAPSSEPILPPYLKYLTISVCLLGLYFGYMMSFYLTGQHAFLLTFTKLNYASCGMWFLAPLSTQKMLPAPYWVGHQFLKTLDQGWEELAGGQGALALSSSSSSTATKAQRMVVTSHLTLSALILPISLALLMS